MADRLLGRGGLLLLLTAGVLLIPAVALAQRKVVDVTFEGNEAFSTSELEKLTRVGRHPFPRPKPTFNILVLNRDRTYLRAYYHNRGYLQCRVEDRVESVGEDGLIVHFTIVEGPLTTLDRFEFTGNSMYDAAELVAIIEHPRGLHIREGDPINESAVQAGAQEIVKRYRNEGYYFIRVRPRVGLRDSISGAAPVIFNISEGPQVTVSGLRMEGARNTRDRIIEREVTLKEGDFLIERERLESQRRLYSTGLFRTVSVTVGEINPDSTRAVILVTVNEMPLRYFGTGIGVTRDLGDVELQQQVNLLLHSSAQWGHRNLLGTGRSIELNASADFQVITVWQIIQRELSLRYQEPWLFGTRTRLTAQLSIRPRRFQTYNVDEAAMELGAMREFALRNHAWINYAYRYLVTKELLTAEETSSLSGINAGFERDSRDNMLSPTRGSVTGVRFNTYAGLQNRKPSYSTGTITWSRYTLSGSRTVVAIRGRVGLAWPNKRTGTEEVPIFDKFFLGGANTVRGYGEGVLGPKNVGGDPVGGEVMGLANLEIRRQRQAGPVGLLLFADAGQVWRDPDHMRRHFKLKYGAGIEAFIDTPIGPVRVGYGWKVVPNSSQGAVFRQGVLHVSVMYAF